MSLIKKIGIVILGLIVLLAIGSVIYSRFRPKPKTELGESETPATTEPAIEPFIAGSLSDLAASADGKTLGYLDTSNFTFVHYDLDTQTPASSNVTAVPDQVVWSRDLSRVIIKTANLPSARTENPDFVPERPEGSAVWRVAVFSTGDKKLFPDGIEQAVWLGSGIVATRAEDQTTRFVALAAESLEEQELVKVAEGSLEWRAAPSGETIVAWTRSEQATIYLIDVKSKKVSQVKGSGTIKDLTISPDGTTALFAAKTGAEQRLFKIDLKSRKLTRAPVNLDLSLSAWLDSDRLAVVKGNAIVEYRPSDDTLSEPGTPAGANETIRQLVSAGGELYVLTDSGIFRP